MRTVTPSLRRSAASRWPRPGANSGNRVAPADTRVTDLPRTDAAISPASSTPTAPAPTMAMEDARLIAASVAAEAARKSAMLSVTGLNGWA